MTEYCSVVRWAFAVLPFDHLQLAAKDLGQKSSLSAGWLQKAGVDALGLRLDQITHGLDFPLGGEYLAVIGYRAAWTLTCCSAISVRLLYPRTYRKAREPSAKMVYLPVADSMRFRPFPLAGERAFVHRFRAGKSRVYPWYHGFVAIKAGILQEGTPSCKNTRLQQLGFFVNLRPVAEGGKRHPALFRRSCAGDFLRFPPLIGADGSSSGRGLGGRPNRHPLGFRRRDALRLSLADVGAFIFRHKADSTCSTMSR